MRWPDFLEKIKDFKELCAAGQLNLNAGGMTSLLFAGCFDSMIDEPKPIKWQRYMELCADLKAALGSEAMLPKAKKTEALGIADIDSEIKLNMWRYQANPIHKFSLADHFRGFMQSEGFRKSSAAEKKMIFFKPEPDNQPSGYRNRIRAIHVWESWKYVFENNKVFEHYSVHEDRNGNKKYPDANIAFLGMIQDLQARPLKNGKESYTFKLFLGGETTDDIRVWSGEQGFVPHAIRQHLKNGNVGVAIVRINKYHDKPSGALNEWIPAGNWQV